MCCSVHGCALLGLLQQFHSLHVLAKCPIPLLVLLPVAVRLVVSLHERVEGIEAVKRRWLALSSLLHLERMDIGNGEDKEGEEEGV